MPIPETHAYRDSLAVSPDCRSFLDHVTHSAGDAVPDPRFAWAGNRLTKQATRPNDASACHRPVAALGLPPARALSSAAAVAEYRRTTFDHKNDSSVRLIEYGSPTHEPVCRPKAVNPGVWGQSPQDSRSALRRENPSQEGDQRPRLEVAGVQTQADGLGVGDEDLPSRGRPGEEHLARFVSRASCPRFEGGTPSHSA